MSISIESVPLGIRMTIRFEGLMFTQVNKLHEVVQTSRAKTQTCGQLLNQPGDHIKFIEVTKAELKSPDGLYNVLLTIYPTLVGWVYPPINGDRRWAQVQPSRDGLDAIWDALGILPVADEVEDRPIPANRGGGGY